ncbi:MAG: PfkB family carbohydrate kinase, partial [Draconibacterium sp.]|nr:PfkB family carbohydrate kinase [Draconibacterium sp.]
MNTTLLKEIIEKIKDVKVAVVGDFCLDAYWFIDESKSEVSIETGKMTRAIRQQKYSLGGAGNVTNNLAAMGVKDIRAFGVIGSDPFGSEMLDLMNKAGIKTSNMLVQKNNWSTHVYTKPYIEDVEQNRIDFGNFNKLSVSVADQLIQNLNNEIPNVDIIIINQQVLSGIHTKYFKKELIKLIKSFPEKIFIADSRNYNNYYEGSYRKMNDKEAAKLCGIHKDPGEIVLRAEVQLAAETLYKRYGKPVIITRGKRGSVMINENGLTFIPALLIMSKIDSVGAGDSYLAGAVSTLAAGYNLENAAEIGTYVAGVTVQKLFQTGTASPDEIFEIGKDPDFIYQPELAEDIRQAKYIDDSEIECIREWKEDLNIKYAIFDHDGTISTLREGWEIIMAPMMMKAVMGEQYEEADEALYHKVHTRVSEFIDKTTGIQTLVQMKGLVDLVREFGLVPEEKILDEFGYKEIYNDELLQMVKEREKKILKKELSLEDVTMKNAVLLLEKLHKAGIKLYLASGTDEVDVKNEARILGYDHLFEGG